MERVIIHTAIVVNQTSGVLQDNLEHFPDLRRVSLRSWVPAVVFQRCLVIGYGICPFLVDVNKIGFIARSAIDLSSDSIGRRSRDK